VLICIITRAPILEKPAYDKIRAFSFLLYLLFLKSEFFLFFSADRIGIGSNFPQNPSFLPLNDSFQRLIGLGSFGDIS
jgi:hypothetical protein